MKKALPVLLFLVALVPVRAATLPSPDPATMMPSEWKEFRFERQAVLQTHPALVAEDRKLNTQIQAQQARVEAAMVKADPGVAPILKKLATLLKYGWGSTPKDTATVTTSEWQKLRMARAAAFQADPSLPAGNIALLKKKKAFEAKVDEALAKQDPGMAAFLAKLKDGRKRSGMW